MIVKRGCAGSQIFGGIFPTYFLNAHYSSYWEKRCEAQMHALAAGEK